MEFKVSRLVLQPVVPRYHGGQQLSQQWAASTGCAGVPLAIRAAQRQNSTWILAVSQLQRDAKSKLSLPSDLCHIPDVHHVHHVHPVSRLTFARF